MPQPLEDTQGGTRHRPPPTHPGSLTGDTRGTPPSRGLPAAPHTHTPGARPQLPLGPARPPRTPGRAAGPALPHPLTHSPADPRPGPAAPGPRPAPRRPPRRRAPPPPEVPPLPAPAHAAGHAGTGSFRGGRHVCGRLRRRWAGGGPTARQGPGDGRRYGEIGASRAGRVACGPDPTWPWHGAGGLGTC